MSTTFVRRALAVAVAALVLVVVVPVAQGRDQFQSYRNPKQAARLLQAQLNRDGDFRKVTIAVYNPTLLTAKGYIRLRASGPWHRFQSKVYKVSPYRLLMVTSFPKLGGQPVRGYVDTKFPV